MKNCPEEHNYIPLLGCLIVFLAALNHVQGRFDHPYISFLFYGMDAAGDFIPIKQLREKYNRPRHEVPFDSEDEEPQGDA